MKQVALLLTLVGGLVAWAAITLSTPPLEEYSYYLNEAHPRSPKWPAVRAEHLKDHPICEVCGATKVEVHHIKPFHLRRDLELERSNLITLCREHHFKVGHDPDGDGPAKPSWNAENKNVRADAERLRAKLNPTRGPPND